MRAVCLKALTNQGLVALLNLARAMAEETDLEHLLALVVKEATGILQADRSSIFLVDKTTGELVSRVAEKAGPKLIRVPPGKGIVGHVAATGESILIEDAYADARFHPEVDRKTGFRTHTLLTVPLACSNGKCIGALQVLNKKTGSFNSDDLELCQALAAHAAVAIEQARLHMISLEKQKLVAALDIARQVQESLRPKESPAIDGWELAGQVSPCMQTSGDFFDFIDLERQVAIIVADVVGHDVGSAMIAMAARAFLRACCTPGTSLATLMGRINDLLCEDLTRGRFVTSCTLFLEPGGRSFAYSGAGHGGVKLLRHGSEAFESLDSQSPPLGLVEGMQFVETRVAVEPGDLVIIPSDGVFEAFSKTHEIFGLERLQRAVLQRRQLPVGQLIDEVFAEVRAYQSRRLQTDDWTLVCLRALA